MTYKPVVGLVEKAVVIGSKGRKKVFAKFDSGAAMTSVDIKLAAKIGLGPVISYKKVRSASIPGGYNIRPVVEVKIKINGNIYKTTSNIEDRSHLGYPLLIGRDLIHSNFIIDTEKSHRTYLEKDVNEDLGE